MKYRLFFILSIIVALLVGLRLPIINGYVDYYRVLHNDYNFSYPGDEENKLYVKTKWLLDTKGEYDSVIFGSSRVIMGFSWADLGKGWAKHDIPGGLPKESLNTLQVLLKNKAPLKEVVLAIDDFDIYYHSRKNESDFRYRLYPQTFMERFDFLRFYFFKKMNDKTKGVLKGEITLKKNDHIIHDLSSKVVFDDYQAHEEEIKRMDAWDKDMALNYTADVEGTVKSIDDFVKLCEANNIKVTVFMTPRFYKILYSREYPYMAEFRRQLAEKISFWDFTNLKTGYWSDSHFWAETSHFGTELGSLIIERIRGKIPDSSFGVLVDHNNVEKFITNQYQILAESYVDISINDSNTFIHDSYLLPWQEVDINKPDALNINNKDAVMRVTLLADKNIDTTWHCDAKKTALYLTEGENIRFLPWSASCLQQNKKLNIQAVSVAKIKKHYSRKL